MAQERGAAVVRTHAEQMRGDDLCQIPPGPADARQRRPLRGGPRSRSRGRRAGHLVAGGAPEREIAGRRVGRMGPTAAQQGVRRPGFHGVVEVQHLGTLGGKGLPRPNGRRRGEQVVVGGTDEGVPPGEVPVQEELIRMRSVGAGPGIRHDHVQQIRVAAALRKPSVEQEEAAVEGVGEHRRIRACRVRRRQGLEGARVASPAAEGHLVRAARQQGVGLEQVVHRRADEDVAVVEQHLAIAGQPERLDRVEILQPAGEGRMGGAQAGQPGLEIGGHRLEPHAVGNGVERVLRGLGERVVDDDDVAGEAGMVPEEGTEQHARPARRLPWRPSPDRRRRWAATSYARPEAAVRRCR